MGCGCFFFFSSRRRHTRCSRDWSSDVCSSDLVSLAGADVSRCGADTGGATTSVVCVNDDRELARSRWASVGAGATTEGLMGVALRILSRVTAGAGATTDARSEGMERVIAGETPGAGATTLAVKLSDVRVSAEFNSGVDGTTRGVGNAGATRDERNPSAGGGPGTGLKAS